MMLLTILILLYLALLLWLGIRGTKKDQTLRSFLTTSGTTSATLCALSLVSTVIGGSATLGIGSLAQKIGPAAFWWLGVGAIGLVIHGLFVAPYIRQTSAMTLPHLLALQVGRNAQRWAGLIISVSWIAVTAAQFCALRALLSVVVGGIEGDILYAALALGIILHTAMGGQQGVIRTDALQAVLLLVGFSLTALWCVFDRPQAVMSLDKIPFNDNFGARQWMEMMILVGLTFVIGPDMFSRTFAAASPKAAQRASLGAAPILVFFGIVVTTMALLNIEARQPITDWLLADSPLPTVIVAMLALGLVSALSGSADTLLLSAAGILEKDVCGQERSQAVRLWSFVLGLLAFSSAWISGDIIGLLLKAYSLFVPGVAAPLLFLVVGGVRRANCGIWLASAVSGGVLGLVGNLTGDNLWTFVGIGIASTGALYSVIKARRALP